MTQLERLPDEQWARVLCVVAHPDDLEYGTSAAVASWTRRGVEVAYLLLTSGEAGMSAHPRETGPLRAREQREACETVGVQDLTVLEHSDGHLEYGLDLRRDIARRIREFRPDAVITTTFEVEAFGGLNQADHRAAGLAAIDAVRDADNAWVFPDLAEAGLEPWHTRWILISGREDPTHGVEVSGADVDRGVASLLCHRAYLADLPGHPDPGEFIPMIMRGDGELLGAEFAVAFRGYDLGEPLRSGGDETGETA